MNDTVEQRWLQLEQIITEYKAKLWKIGKNDKIDKILNLSELELKALDRDTALSYAYLLAQHSLYIQEQNNLHSSRNNWAKHNLNTLIGKNAKNYGTNYTKWEEKYACIVSENTYAKSLDNMIKESQLYLDTLNFISRKIEIMSNILLQFRRKNDS